MASSDLRLATTQFRPKFSLKSTWVAKIVAQQVRRPRLWWRRLIHMSCASSADALHASMRSTDVRFCKWTRYPRTFTRQICRGRATMLSLLSGAMVIGAPSIPLNDSCRMILKERHPKNRRLRNRSQRNEPINIYSTQKLIGQTMDVWNESNRLMKISFQ